MNRFISVSFDNDIFQLQKYGGIRLYYEQLNSSLSLSHSLKLRHSNSFIPSCVFPPPSFSINSFSQNILSYLSLAYSFVFPLLPSFSPTCFKIYHATYYRNPFLGLSSNPVVITIHDMIHELYSQYFEPEYQPSIRRYIHAKRRCIFAADSIVTVSRSTRNDLLSCYPQLDPARIIVVHHGCDHIPLCSSSPTALRPSFSPNYSKYILFVGSRRHYKGFYDLLSAFSEFTRLYSEYALVCVGVPFSMEEKSILDSLSLLGKVFTVSADNFELPTLYRFAEVFVYPSWYEGFGLPILEAMRLRCPVLCSDIPSSREIAASHAYFFQPRNTSDLLTQVCSLVNLSPESKDRLTSSALAYTSHFSWKKTAELTAKVYHALLK